VIQEVLKVFLINLISDIDNMLILGTILRRYSLFNITIPAILVLTFTRTVYVAIIEVLSKFPLFHLLVGIILLIIAFRLVTRSIKEVRQLRFPNTFLFKVKVLVLLAATDFLICMDSVLVIYEFSTRMLTVLIGIFASLLISLHFLPLIEKMAANFFWINVIAAGFIAQNAVSILAKDPVLMDWIGHIQQWYPNTNFVAITANGTIILVVLTGVISYLKQRRLET